MDTVLFGQRRKCLVVTNLYYFTLVILNSMRLKSLCVRTISSMVKGKKEEEEGIQV